jgi:serine/threonine protein kinase
MSWLLSIARQRDFSQRRTIAHQRDELAGLNSDLERRVAEQVAEIIRRAEEISQLNAQLRSQIRARSNELSLALTRLAKLREGDDKLRAGVVLGERFEIGEKLGAGAMGEVYSGRDRASGAKVAIKVIQPTTAIELDAMQRFVGEAAMVAAISHPAVVRMIHVDLTADGFLYQAQELLEGETLEERMHSGAWPEARVARFGAVLFDALAAAHAHGVIHRDVKPANVMLIDKDPGLKLLDFGLAKLFDRASSEAVTRTSTGLVVGTPAYMAPEQVLAQDVTGKADVYSSGLLLFQLLTGRLVFEVDGASRIMMSHVGVSAPDVRTIKTGVSDDLANLIGDCLRKEPSERPTASEAAARLSAFADAAGAPALEVLLRAPASSAILRRFH